MVKGQTCLLTWLDQVAGEKLGLLVGEAVGLKCVAQFSDGYQLLGRVGLEEEVFDLPTVEALHLELQTQLQEHILQLLQLYSWDHLLRRRWLDLLLNRRSLQLRRFLRRLRLRSLGTRVSRGESGGPFILLARLRLGWRAPLL